MELQLNSLTISVVMGELAFQAVDALIHPTNNYLWFATGFSQTLKERGGEWLEQEAIQLGPIEVGTAVITKAGRLKSRYLIHAAAWEQSLQTSKAKVRQAVLSALALASQNRCQSAALPPVGAGVGTFSLPLAIEATFFAIVEHSLQPTTLERICLLAGNTLEEKILNDLLQLARDAAPRFIEPID